MAPWSPPREKPHYVWVPEGSCFPPSYLKCYLRGRYGPVATHPPFTPSGSRLAATSKSIERTESASRSRPLRRCASHCTPHPRVPDRTPAYIPLSFSPVRTHGRPRRWSLSVPPSYLGTEILTRRLESQRIDAIASAESAQSDAPNDDPSLPLPAIKVSTSTTTIAISFPGSPERATPTPEPLAIRRGQKMLVPLKVHSAQRAAEEYPGIPTAFLGTPSAYSPHFDFTSSIAQVNAKSIPIGDMISALRSQAASLKVSSPAEERAPLLDIPPSSANSLSASSSDIAPSISEDDWAFAQDLMSRYGDRVQDKTPSEAKHRQQQVPSARKSHVPRPRSATTSRVQRASVPAASSTPNNRPKLSLAPRIDLIKPRHSTGITKQCKDYIGTTKHVSHPDSTPSPPLRLPSPVTPNHSRALPSESSNNSRSERSTKRPPGILKRVKSVRFADMPKPEDARDNAPTERQPRTSTSKDVGGSPSLQPSPLRTCFMPEELEVQTPSRQPPATPTTEEESTQVFTVDQRGSVQLTPSQTVNLNGSMSNLPSLPATPWLSDKSSLSGSHGSRAPKRLSLLVRDRNKDKEKENSPLALRAQRRARRHTEVDENASRRASSRGSRKHRLSSPLKSFLERLRA
jgi:hypothetical protein